MGGWQSEQSELHKVKAAGRGRRKQVGQSERVASTSCTPTTIQLVATSSAAMSSTRRSSDAQQTRPVVWPAPHRHHSSLRWRSVTPDGWSGDTGSDPAPAPAPAPAPTPPALSGPGEGSAPAPAEESVATAVELEEALASGAMAPPPSTGATAASSVPVSMPNSRARRRPQDLEGGYVRTSYVRGGTLEAMFLEAMFEEVQDLEGGYVLYPRKYNT